jgi:tRNA uridine 5-carboxymethylaminomethyl modification enzyme
VTEPYRLFTSRAEYRLVLREDNTDWRLMEKGHRLGLITDDEVKQLREKKKMVAEGIEELKGRKVTVDMGQGLPRAGSSLHQALCNARVSYRDLVKCSPDFVPSGRPDVAEQIEIQVKYAGYIRRQEAMVSKVRALEEMPIPEGLDFSSLQALSREVSDRLAEVRPRNLGQASRIPGVTPAAVSALMVYLRGAKGNKEKAREEKRE